MYEMMTDHKYIQVICVDLIELISVFLIFVYEARGWTSLNQPVLHRLDEVII